MRDNQNYKMYIKVQISLPGSIKRYWFINLDLLHLLVNCKTIRSIYSLKLFGREKFFKLLIIAHIKLLGKLALFCFTVDSIFANLLLQIFDNIKTTIAKVIWIFFPSHSRTIPILPI